MAVALASEAKGHAQDGPTRGSSERVEWLKCRQSVVYFVARYVWIYNATTTEWLPFALWPAQQMVLREMARALKLLVLKKHGKRDYLRQLVRDRRERRRVVTHLDACRLPPRLSNAYTDLLSSPSLTDRGQPLSTRTLLVIGDGEDLVHADVPEVQVR